MGAKRKILSLNVELGRAIVVAVLNKNTHNQFKKSCIETDKPLVYNIIFNRRKTMTTYTPEQTKTILELYQTGTAVESIALTVGKTVRSVVAKLSREGVYKAAVKETQGPRATKETLVREIETKLGLASEALDSLEKCSRDQLILLVGKL